MFVTFIQMASLVLVCFFSVENQPKKNKYVSTKLREKREQFIYLPVRRARLFIDKGCVFRGLVMMMSRCLSE